MEQSRTQKSDTQIARGYQEQNRKLCRCSVILRARCEVRRNGQEAKENYQQVIDM